MRLAAPASPTRTAGCQSRTIIAKMFCLILVILFNISLSQSSSAIKKCCPENNILNLKYYECEYSIKENELKTIVTKRGYSLKNFGFPKCEPNHTFLHKNISFYFKSNKHYYSDVCVETTNDNNYVVLACSSESTVPYVSQRASIKKCCPMFQMIMLSPLGSCGATNRTFNLKSLSNSSEIYPSDFDISSPGCVNKDILTYDPYGRVIIQESGMLFVQNYSKVLSNKNEYCVDLVEEEENTYGFFCTGIEQILYEYVLISIGLMISIVLLIISFIVYTCEVKKQNLYGKTLMCHIGSITVAYICLAVQQMQTVFYQLPLYICDYLRFIMFFSFLAAFLWLNVMSIDIWRTFRSIRSRDGTPSRKILRFFMYSLYSWGISGVLTVFARITTQYDILPSIISLTMNGYGCWFTKNNYGYFLFFIFPIACTLCCNTVLYVITAWKCYQIKKDINTMNRAGKKQTNSFFKNKEQLKLNIKLFLVMGITWIMEVISVLVKSKYNDSSYAYVWYLSDALNALYGLIIFVIFAMKKKNMKVISRQFSKWTLKRNSENINLRKTSSTMNHSTVSTSMGDTLSTCDAD